VDKRELQDILVTNYLLDRRNVIDIEVWQSCPYTAAKVIVKKLPPGNPHDGKWHDAIGFAKVKWPDDWDADYGRDLAIRKAIAKLAKRLSESE